MQYKRLLSSGASWDGDPDTGAPPFQGRDAVERLVQMMGIRLPVLADIGLAAMARRNQMAYLDFKALVCIAQLEPLKTGVLADILGISPGGVTAILGRLEDRGLIRRDRFMKDRRQVLLCLAHDQGFGDIFPDHVASALTRVFEQWNPEDLERMADLLTQCLEAMTRDLEHWFKAPKRRRARFGP